MFDYQRQQGASILEIMLMVALVAVLLLAAMQRLIIWNATYKQQKNVAQVQEFVAAMLQGVNAYYYATCKTSPGSVSGLMCSQLVASGGITQQQCNAMSSVSPWGSSFSAGIVQQGAAPNYVYSLQVTGVFNSYPNDITKLGVLLNADAYVGGNQLQWTRLPSNRITVQGVWYRVPGNYLSATNSNEIGGNHFDSGMWIMKAGLAQFAKSQNGTQCPD